MKSEQFGARFDTQLVVQRGAAAVKGANREVALSPRHVDAHQPRGSFLVGGIGGEAGAPGIDHRSARRASLAGLPGSRQRQARFSPQLCVSVARIDGPVRIRLLGDHLSVDSEERLEGADLLGAGGRCDDCAQRGKLLLQIRLNRQRLVDPDAGCVRCQHDIPLGAECRPGHGQRL